MIRVLIADDHAIFSDGLMELLSKEENLEIRPPAKTGLEALERLKMFETDIVLMDLNMPEMSGDEATKIIKEEHPQVKVLVLTTDGDFRSIGKLLECGADGYVLKTSGKTEIMEAINVVSRGDTYLGPSVQQSLAQRFRSPEPSRKAVSLTKRETRVLELICRQLTTQEIANELFISPSTVETHRKKLMAKTNAKNVIGLVLFAVENGIHKET